MTVVGICGGSGSGKSSLCDYLRDLGHPVADCDAIYRQITTPPSRCLDAIVCEFGENALDENGMLNRGFLRELVFSDPGRRQRLNEITFGFIGEQVQKRLSEAEKEGKSFFFIDAPLLFESDLVELCHYTLGILASKEQRISRLQQRDGLAREQIEARLRNQMKDEELISRCSAVLHNEQTVSQLYEAMDALLRKWDV